MHVSAINGVRINISVEKNILSMDSRSSKVYCSRFRKNNWDCAIVL